MSEPASEPDSASPTRAKTRSGVVVHYGRPTTPERFVYRTAWWILNGIGRGWLRTTVEGVEKIQTDRPFILAPSHRSNIDFLLVAIARKQRMRFLAKDTLWRPGVGRLWSALGGIPVARGTADREALRSCQSVIEHGEPLVIFPEGTRQAGPTIQPLYDGPAFVQARTGAPIIPMGIGGSEAAMPKGSKGIKRVPIHIVIGDPLPAPVVAGAKAKRAAIRDRTAELHTVLQRLFDEAESKVPGRTVPGGGS